MNVTRFLDFARNDKKKVTPIGRGGCLQTAVEKERFEKRPSLRGQEDNCVKVVLKP
jgi:hypothetical protein